MRLLERLRLNERGAAALEFAILAPALILMIVGIGQIGILFHANAGLRNAVAEGARFATIYPRPDDEDIIARITSSEFGLVTANMTTPTITHGTDAGVDYVDITMSYNVPLNFVFFEAPAVTLSETRRAYINPPTPA
jgi:Flp pilus assembly protein TadG